MAWNLCAPARVSPGALTHVHVRWCMCPPVCTHLCVSTRVHVVRVCVLAAVALKHSHRRSSAVLCLPVVHIFHLFYISPTYYDKKSLCDKTLLGLFYKHAGVQTS